MRLWHWQWPQLTLVAEPIAGLSRLGWPIRISVLSQMPDLDLADMELANTRKEPTARTGPERAAAHSVR
jgi:hypothetical protein